MVSVDARDISAIFTAFALAAAAPLGRALNHWSHHRVRKVTPRSSIATKRWLESPTRCV